MVRLNILSRVGREAAGRYGVRGMPTLVIVDQNGQPVYGRYGVPLPSQIVGEVEALLAAN